MSDHEVLIKARGILEERKINWDNAGVDSGAICPQASIMFAITGKNLIDRESESDCRRWAKAGESDAALLLAGEFPSLEVRSEFRWYYSSHNELSDRCKSWCNEPEKVFAAFDRAILKAEIDNLDSTLALC